MEAPPKVTCATTLTTTMIMKIVTRGMTSPSYPKMDRLQSLKGDLRSMGKGGTVENGVSRRLEATRRLPFFATHPKIGVSRPPDAFRFLGPTLKWTVLKGLEDNLGGSILRATPKWTVLKGLEEDLGEPEASILALF